MLEICFIIFVAENVILSLLVIFSLIWYVFDWRENRRQNKIKAYANLCSKYGDDLINNLKDII